MGIDNNLIESLLYEEEGVELDLKRDQYKFAVTNDEEKSELLKDILAFANAWRRSDAFILIGVKEVKGGRSKVVGISDLLDDAAVQQFVNSKTNRPVIFSYQNLPFEDKRIAVIHIPTQQRPIYLKKDFGKLKSETVYVRRGSSTAIASIDEISRMGIQAQPERGKPDLEVFFADPKTRTRLASEQAVKSLVLEIPKSSTIPDYTQERRYPFDVGLSHGNYSYYRELANYTRVSRLVSPLYIAVGNSGSATAQDVRLEMKIDKAGENVVVIGPYEYPDVPKREYNSFYLPTRTAVRAAVTYDFKVGDIGDLWVVEARGDKVQPKATYWFTDPFYVGSMKSCQVHVEISIFSDEMSTPKQQQLLVNVQTEQRKVDLEGILELEGERFRSSPEFKRFMQMHKEIEEE
jgi:hypothetical protein